MLEVSIKKRYKDFYLELEFKAEAQTLGIMGESGAGKSQLLRAIAGIMTPDEGFIRLGDKVFFDKQARKSPRVNLKPQERQVGYLFQNYQLFPNMSLADNICAGMNSKLSSKEKKELLDSYVSFFKLEGLLEKHPRQLSGGQQQRVALARMLASQPKIMMFDEPFSALDSNLKAELYPELLESLKVFEGPRLYISHDIDEACLFCDRINVLDKGRIVDSGKVQDLMRQPKALASMKLVGVNNISRAQAISQNEIKALDWNTILRLDRPCPQDLAYVGIRDTQVELLDEDAPRGINQLKAELLFDNPGVYRHQISLRLCNATHTQIRCSYPHVGHEGLKSSSRPVTMYFAPKFLHVANH